MGGELLPSDLADRLPTAALAFRGYNVENLGRTPELLAVSAYRPIVEARLGQVGDLCASITGRPVDLVRRVAERREADLDDYAEAVALVFAVELAQVDLLRSVHGVDATDASLALGYSLGELAALCVAGVADAAPTLGVPLTFAGDCADLSAAMGVVFSRGAALDEDAIHGLCEEITAEGDGAVAVSSVLSPNTVLALGQGDTLDRFARRAKRALDAPVHVRRNDALWPPLHTPIVRQRAVCDRAAVMIQKMRIRREPPRPRVVSLVTGATAYHDRHARAVLRDWIDRPQRLWDGVRAVLQSDARTVLHFGPAPNLIPATFRRLADNVRQQTGEWSVSGFGLSAVQRLADRRWLAAVLPEQTSLLRAPKLRHVVVEDWLLEHAPRS